MDGPQRFNLNLFKTIANLKFELDIQLRGVSQVQNHLNYHSLKVLKLAAQFYETLVPLQKWLFILNPVVQLFINSTSIAKKKKKVQNLKALSKLKEDVSKAYLKSKAILLLETTQNEMFSH